MPGHSVERRGPFPAGAGLFRAFDAFPVGPDLVHILELEVAKDMRMPANQFLHQDPADLVKVERATLAAKLCVKHHLKQQIAQFLNQFDLIAGLHGVHQFVSLFDGMPQERLVVLLPIPRTPIRGPQGGHDFEHLINGRQTARG